MAKKDEALRSLRDQVAALSHQLHATEEVLSKQQAELGAF
jgi:hypothetical protein